MYRLLPLALLISLSACSVEQPATPAPATPPAVGGNNGAPTVLVVGDSLSAAYGIDSDRGWVSLLQRRLDKQDKAFNVVNASISGDTTSGGLARLPAALARHEPAIVVIELGGNDGLRAIPLPVIRKNLHAMIETSQAAGAQVVLLGMRIPPNYGQRYADGFAELFKNAAEQYDLAFVEFFLDGVALNRRLMLPDGIHPNAEAQPRLLDNAWGALQQVIEQRS